MKSIIRLTDRPADIPAHWPICNAPRPLYGTRTWQGDFIHGVFYAAIDPADEFSAGWLKRNEELDAYEIIYMSRDEAISVALAFYRDNFPAIYPKIKADDPDHQRMILDGWAKHRNKV